MIPVFDGHNDTILSPSKRNGTGRSFFEQSTAGHVDLPRAKAVPTTSNSGRSLAIVPFPTSLAESNRLHRKNEQ